MIQRLIYSQPRDHKHLCDTKRSFAVAGFQDCGEVAEHFAGGIEGFAVAGRVGQEHGVVFGVAADDALLWDEVVIEGA